MGSLEHQDGEASVQSVMYKDGNIQELQAEVQAFSDTGNEKNGCVIGGLNFDDLFDLTDQNQKDDQQNLKQKNAPEALLENKNMKKEKPNCKDNSPSDVDFGDVMHCILLSSEKKPEINIVKEVKTNPSLKNGKVSSVVNGFKTGELSFENFLASISQKKNTLHTNSNFPNEILPKSVSSEVTKDITTERDQFNLDTLLESLDDTKTKNPETPNQSPRKIQLKKSPSRTKPVLNLAEILGIKKEESENNEASIKVCTEEVTSDDGNFIAENSSFVHPLKDFLFSNCNFGEVADNLLEGKPSWFATVLGCMTGVYEEGNRFLELLIDVKSYKTDFTFSEPSPDDVVRHHQKLAFGTGDSEEKLLETIPEKKIFQEVPEVLCDNIFAQSSLRRTYGMPVEEL